MPRKPTKPAPAEGGYTVLRDTAEHAGHGWRFDPSERCQGTVERNLYTGDYSLEGYYQANLLVIERKGSIAEFVGNLTHKDKWRNFKDELGRMEQFRWPYLVLEFDLALLRAFPEGSGIPRSRWPYLRATPQFLLKRICEIELNFKTRIVFVGNGGKEYASSLFKRVVEAVPCPN